MTATKERLTYARICVEVNVEDTLPETVPIRGPNQEILEQKIAYEWKPLRYTYRQEFGQLEEKCFHKPKVRQDRKVKNALVPVGTPQKQREKSKVMTVQANENIIQTMDVQAQARVEHQIPIANKSSLIEAELKSSKEIDLKERDDPQVAVCGTDLDSIVVYLKDFREKPRNNEVKQPILPEPSRILTRVLLLRNPRTILIDYVDDIILTGDDYEEMNRLKTILAKEFEIKDLGKLKYFLGMEVARSNKGILISQRKYTLDLLKETGILGCQPVDTPMDPTCKLGIKEGSTPVDKGRYQRLIGRFIYFSHTRPDIGFFVNAIGLDLLQTGDPLLISCGDFIGRNRSYSRSDSEFSINPLQRTSSSSRFLRDAVTASGSSSDGSGILDRWSLNRYAMPNSETRRNPELHRNGRGRIRGAAYSSRKGSIEAFAVRVPRYQTVQLTLLEREALKHLQFAYHDITRCTYL
ncbi:hypothetical protein RJ640_009887 [Escallonia rubra]|uniref:Reverse transcriptase Ty1/copia-type domain-containing protein n=1 Tax=Escallonia rubra TaxID=112253 RepID=A0AA88RDY1_9ASTE|nr:hypothetical protein RJ640_009887 [Escallonia rubra]